jgi:DNA helicase-2/ATP-dependent DNA helicase PcrA
VEERSPSAHPSEPAGSAQPKLNPAQRQAVEHGTGPVLVLAGAGSGKTRVITHRIVGLLERGTPPRAIVALTFTNKAAGEMRERVAHTLGGRRGRSPVSALTVSTFHSFGLMVLGQEKEALGGAFTIFDQGDQTSLIKQLLRAAGADRSYDAQAVLARISNAKNAFLSAEEMPNADAYDEIARVVYPRYQAALRQYKAFDFDDLVCEVARFWRRDEAARARWQDKFLYILVDEYQDTNRAQLELLRLLAGDRKNVCAVGDDDQAIYGWRGADVRNILDFDQHFPGARVIKLEQNYRSRMPVLDVANAVIARRTDAKWRKVLFSDRPGGEKVGLVVAPTPEVEATWVARDVRRLVREEGVRPRNVAVLYRSNAQSALIEAALREQGIAHRVVGGAQFFERKEVKDVLAYMKLALNPSDEISLRRVINHPPRGIGETSLEKLALAAATRGWSLWQSVERCDALDDLPNGARDGCRALAQALADARRDLGAGRPPSVVARSLCDAVKFDAEIDTSAQSPTAAAKRRANVQGLLATLARREEREGPGTDGLASFLRALTMDIEPDSEDTGDVVTLSTLHGSKGLEFDYVFLIGCEEGYLPHARTIDTRATDASEATGGADIEEERRLFYVGITRARDRLVLSRARTRVLRGKPMPRTPSRFLLEIPADLLDARDVKDEAPTSAHEAAANVEAILALLGPR